MKLTGWFWTRLYTGTDEQKWLEVRSRLEAAGIPCKAFGYTQATRLAAQSMQNMQNPSYARRSNVGPEALQAKLLHQESLNSYSVEVRRRDAARAHDALRQG